MRKDQRAKQILRQAIKEENIKFIVKLLFNIDLTEKQQDIVRDIAFRKEKRMTISAMTRYGKTFCVAIAVALLIIFNKKLKVALIAPQAEQAQIIRKYLVELIFQCPMLYEIAQLESKGTEKIKKEASKKRQTFINGSEYAVFSAEGDANRLMGFGADVVIKDESCLIQEKANPKITRMLGDNPEEGMIVELYNPWTRDNITFEHSLNPNWKHYKIDYRIAIEEGRTTEEYIEEQRKEMTKLEFQVLYESDFPDESEDSIFNLKKIEEAKRMPFNFENELIELEKIMKNKNKYTESRINETEREMKKYTRIISCDPADMGLDKTVIYRGIKKDLKYQQTEVYSEDKSEPMQIVGKIMQFLAKDYCQDTRYEIFIDKIGIGSGPISRLKEIIKSRQMKNIKIYGCGFGEKPINEENYRNKKAENYFRLKNLFDEGMIKIKDERQMTNQLLQMKWKLTSTGKIEIVDPEKSPDFCDGLVYLIWKEKEKFTYQFG
ncbi:MAG: terminase large subunit domain-containing protein [Atribacterota bacterium]